MSFDVVTNQCLDKISGNVHLAEESDSGWFQMVRSLQHQCIFVREAPDRLGVVRSCHELASGLESSPQGQYEMTHLSKCQEVVRLIPKAEQRAVGIVGGEYEGAYHEGLLAIRQILKRKGYARSEADQIALLPTQVVLITKELDWSRLKIQALEERLRLEMIRKYGPKSEMLSDGQLSLLELEQARPLLESIRDEMKATQVAALPASALGKAVSYTLSLWHKLTRFVEHPELELSNNLAENSMRGITLGRKNWIHVGSEQAGPKVAAILSVIESCRRMKLPVRDYPGSVLPGLSNRSIQRVSQLTPAAWAASRP